MANTIHADGTPVQAGRCVTVDNQIQTFVVQVRSMAGIHPDQLKRVIQTRYEVLNVTHQEKIIVVP